MLRTLLSFRALILVFGLVAVGLPIALVAQLGVVRALSDVNHDLAQVRGDQLASADVLIDQVDEETGIRGFAATNDPVFLEPYERGRTALAAHLDSLAGVREGERDGQRRAAVLADLRSTHDTWLRTVAAPVLAGRRDKQVQLRGKGLVDRFRADVKILQDALAADYGAAVVLRDRMIRTTAVVSAAAIGVIVIEIVALGFVLTRMRHELDRERRIAEILQSSAAVRLVVPPYLNVGTVYRSATRGARLGGDVYDVYRLDRDRTLIVIGDVSGKGLTAAVETTFVRYAVRALATEHDSPAMVVAKFDALYQNAEPSPEAFVTLFVGVYAHQAGTLRYANAGHEACWIRYGSRAAMLPPTGPIIGLGSFDAEESVVPLGPGDTLLLATDGLTEARDPDGGFIATEKITGWVAAAVRREPQALAEELLEAVRRHTRGAIADDLAVLAVAPRA